MNATITSVKEQKAKYGDGMEKVCDITTDDGNNSKVYVKDKAHWVYNEIKPGVYVELKPKDTGPGYLVHSIIGETPANQPPAKNGQAPAKTGRHHPSREEVGEYIKAKAGQYAYAYKCLQEAFDDEKVAIIVTEETLRQAAATVIISMDRNLY